MKIFLLLIATSILSIAGQTVEITDNLEVIIVDSKGNTTNGGRLNDHFKMRPAEVQAACETKLNAKFASDKKQAVKDAKVMKDIGVTIPTQIINDTESWIETDANDPVKAKQLKDANVVPPAEGIGAQISAEAKGKIENAK